jgi:hypothetical protein
LRDHNVEEHQMTQANTGADRPREAMNLDQRYRDIGISAVTAALRYTAPADVARGGVVAASPGIDPRFIEAAA